MVMEASRRASPAHIGRQAVTSLRVPLKNLQRKMRIIAARSFIGINPAKFAGKKELAETNSRKRIEYETRNQRMRSVRVHGPRFLLALAVAIAAGHVN